jgi:hypothetical protein
MATARGGVRKSVVLTVVAEGAATFLSHIPAGLDLPAAVAAVVVS